MGTKLLPLERNPLVKPPGLCPRLRFPAEKEMQTNPRDKKHKEQEPDCTPALPRIYNYSDDKQHAVFDNAKPARLRMQGDVFFLPVKFLEGHVLFVKVDSGVECQANEKDKK
ncbi:MAG: hypothetical protein ABL936_06460 [Aestuariivirga sp.]